MSEIAANSTSKKLKNVLRKGSFAELAGNVSNDITGYLLIDTH